MILADSGMAAHRLRSADSCHRLRCSASPTNETSCRQAAFFAEQLEGLKAVYVDHDQADICSLWALSNAQAQWFNRTSEVMAGSVFRFSPSADAVYVKFQFGGSQ